MIRSVILMIMDRLVQYSFVSRLSAEGSVTSKQTVNWLLALITLRHSEATIQVIWSLSVNQRPVTRSLDHSQPIRSKCPGHMITLSQSEASIQVTWSLSTNQRPVFRSRDHSRLCDWWVGLPFDPDEKIATRQRSRLSRPRSFLWAYDSLYYSCDSFLWQATPGGSTSICPG